MAGNYITAIKVRVNDYSVNYQNENISSTYSINLNKNPKIFLRTARKELVSSFVSTCILI